MRKFVLLLAISMATSTIGSVEPIAAARHAAAAKREAELAVEAAMPDKSDAAGLLHKAKTLFHVRFSSCVHRQVSCSCFLHDVTQQASGNATPEESFGTTVPREADESLLQRVTSSVRRMTHAFGLTAEDIKDDLYARSGASIKRMLSAIHDPTLALPLMQSKALPLWMSWPKRPVLNPRHSVTAS